jgi:hypothetical protein
VSIVSDIRQAVFQYMRGHTCPPSRLLIPVDRLGELTDIVSSPFASTHFMGMEIEVSDGDKIEVRAAKMPLPEPPSE